MNLTWLLFTAGALAATTPTPTTPPSTDSGWSSVRNALQSMTIPSLALPTNSGNLANISPPPRYLIGQVISAVPVSVIMDLFDPSKRRALGSEIQAGSTPTWYQNLPTDIKDYMAVVKSQVSEGALTASPTASNSDSGSRSGSVSNQVSATATAAETTTGQGTSASDTNSGGRIQPGGVEVAIPGAIAIMGVMSLLQWG